MTGQHGCRQPAKGIVVKQQQHQLEIGNRQSAITIQLN
jgi:hypothetical protein